MSINVNSTYLNSHTVSNNQLGLWSSYKNGNADALGDIYIEYFDLLCLYGRQFSPEDPSLVEDCIQDLFLQLYTNRNKNNLSDTTSIKFYLMKSLRRSILSAIKKNSKKNIVLSENDSYEDFLGSSLLDKEKIGIKKEVLKNSILLLPIRQKEAIYLRYFSELGYYDISIKMKLNIKSVYKLIYKGLYSLRQTYNLKFIFIIIINYFNLKGIK